MRFKSFKCCFWAKIDKSYIAIAVSPRVRNLQLHASGTVAHEAQKKLNKSITHCILLRYRNILLEVQQ